MKTSFDATRGVAVMLLLAPIVLSGCGGGGGGGGPRDAAPTVLSVKPAADATEVAADSVVSATFSEAVECATVDERSFTVTDAAGAAVGASVTCAGNGVVLTPATRLAPGQEYTATLSSTVTDRAGNALAAPHRWTFAVRERAWGMPSAIAAHDGDITAYKVVTDGNGGALAVWRQDVNGRGDLWSARFLPRTGWGAPELLETDDTGGVEAPDAAFDASGNALVVWTQEDAAGRFRVWARRYVAGAGWGAAEPVEANQLSCEDPRVVFAANGDALVVWLQGETNGVMSVWGNRFSGGKWGTAAGISSGVSVFAQEPALVADRSGNAFAAWSDQGDLWASRYSAGAGWGAPVQVENRSGRAQSPGLAMDGSGNAVIVWGHEAQVGYDILASRYAATGAGWGEAVLIGSGADPYPALVADGLGNATAAWRQSDGVSVRVATRRYTADGGWGAAQSIEGGDGTAGGVALVDDRRGGTLALWLQSDKGATALLAARNGNGSGWGVAAVVATGGPAAPAVAAAAGDVVAVWRQHDGTQMKLFASFFDRAAAQ